MTDNKLDFLINCLLTERGEKIKIPESEHDKFRLYRSLVNVRPAAPASDEYYAAENALLTELTANKGITDIAELTPREPHIYLWHGDITTLKCGAIVNAANSGMTGCYHPCHNCIDNCIHTFAGIRLREKCDEIMRAQGHEEPTGAAKITPAYNLPCEYVIHTVGPIVQGQLTDEHCGLLERCYKSCLDIAVQNGLKSIAFCCISTGVFGFPPDEAAQIAVNTVRDYLKTHDIEVIFNVFTKTDFDIYNRLLG
ncbi:MAG: protein-ADP-ribose hydrolase [Ruminiclostridium sp.]|nr:protein-ADP-ribose hydrolase [Ruminiclostridium sp.]